MVCIGDRVRERTTDSFRLANAHRFAHAQIGALKAVIALPSGA